MDVAIISRIAHDLGLPESSISSTADLFDKGATAPFIARYRKELTNGLDGAKVRSIEERLAYYKDVQDRRAALVKLLADQKKATEDLQQRIACIYSKVELEDLFQLHKPKKKTRAAEAQEKGLGPLAEYLWNQEPDAWSLEVHADAYKDPDKGISSGEQALQGALEIVAEWISENLEVRGGLREMLWNEGSVVSTVVPAKAAQKTKYTMYYDRREAVKTIPSHRVLAIRRGTKEGVLASAIECDPAKAIEFILSVVIRDRESIFAPLLERAARDSYSRILRPLIETEVRGMLKERADREAIRVFQDNLANLLLTPPAGGLVVMGIDITKGDECRLAIVDEKGRLLEEAAMSLRAPRSAPVLAPIEHPSAPVAPEEPKSEAALSDSPALPALDVARAEDLPQQETTTGENPDIAGEAPASADLEMPSASQGDPGVSGDAVPSPPDAATNPHASTIGPDGTLSEISSRPAAIEEPSAPPPAGEVDSRTAPSEPAAAAADVREAETTDLEAASISAAVEASSVEIPADQPLPPASEPEHISRVESAEPKPMEPQVVPAEAPKPSPARPHLRAIDIEETRILLRALIKHFSVRALAIGSSAGARNLEMALRQILADEKIDDVLIAAVNDAGVAIYASSRIAREELHDLNISARCAVSLARRLQDPLAELVKIDPKLIGVGQYQHDVDQKELHRGLLQIVRACVNSVGLDPNTAGQSALRYIAGFNDRLARRLIAARNANGPFTSRASLLTVPGLDQAIFQQCAGFLRIRGAENPLDGTAIHPECYTVVEKMAAAAGVTVADLIGNREKISSLKLDDFVSDSTGLPTLQDIRDELLRPGRDPRRAFALPKLRADVREIRDLKEGMTLEGTVTNVTNFGAFVDIGVRQDGLVHLSQMSNRFIRDPREAVKVGDIVQVKVLSVEEETRRIGLSIKALLPPIQRRRKKGPRRVPHRPAAETSPAQSAIADPPATESKPVAEAPPIGAAGRGKPFSGRREGDRRRPPRRRDNRAERSERRPARPPQAAQGPSVEITPPEPELPEQTLQEKIAILQSKFKGIK